MENQTQLRTNYLALKNVSDQCECPQSMKCTVDVNRISAVLDTYYVKFQNLSKEKNKRKTSDNDLSVALSKETTVNQQSHICRGNDAVSTPNNEATFKFGYQEVNANETELQQKLPNAEAEANKFTERISYNRECSISLEHSKSPSHPIATESAARPFQCVECGMAFKRNLHLKRHFTVTHTSKKNFSCSNCSKSFSRKDYLDKHVATHEKKKFKLKLLRQGIVVRTKMNVKSTTK